MKNPLAIMGNMFLAWFVFFLIKQKSLPIAIIILVLAHIGLVGAWYAEQIVQKHIPCTLLDIFGFVLIPPVAILPWYLFSSEKADIFMLGYLSITWCFVPLAVIYIFTRLIKKRQDGDQYSFLWFTSHSSQKLEKGTSEQEVLPDKIQNSRLPWK